MDVHKLKDGDICAQYRDEIAGLTAVSGDVDEKWENIKVEVLRAARQYLTCSSSQRKCHPYLTQETLMLLRPSVELGMFVGALMVEGLVMLKEHMQLLKTM
jgi:hypothetical protein